MSQKDKLTFGHLIQHGGKIYVTIKPKELAERVKTKRGKKKS